MYIHFFLVLHSVVVHMLMSHAEMCECSSCVRRVNNQDMNTGSDYSNSFAFVKTFICPGCTFIVYCCRVSKKIGIFWFWIIVMCLCILLAYSVCGLNKKGFCETNQLWIIVCTQVYMVVLDLRICTDGYYIECEQTSKKVSTLSFSLFSRKVCSKCIAKVRIAILCVQRYCHYFFFLCHRVSPPRKTVLMTIRFGMFACFAGISQSMRAAPPFLIIKKWTCKFSIDIAWTAGAHSACASCLQ